MNGTVIDEVKTKLEHITEDVSSIKKTLMQIEGKDNEKTETAWNDLLSASREISKKWKGPSAVEEIGLQREKCL